MRNQIHILATGALLHDIGKVLYRSSSMDGRSHSISGTDFVKRFTDNKDILDCIRYHHWKEIKDAPLEKDSPAYIVYISDNISSGADRRDIEGEARSGFERNRPLESVFNLLNNRNGNKAYIPGEVENTVKYPEIVTPRNFAPEYSRIVSDFADGLSGISFEPQYINSLIELCEAYLSYVPSSTDLGQAADISLFDHSRITAAIASCIALYAESRGITDYREEYFIKEKNFYDEKAFRVFSMDISGIQQFIYTISSKGALKGLRARSFYLEILLENVADEILTRCKLTRANLLYTGGGHAYILLPNTGEARQAIENTIKTINRKLISSFGTRLFIAYGSEACSANELMSKTSDPESYINIFRSVSSQISAMKLRRYSAEDLRLLNSGRMDEEGRECTVCGVSSDLIYRDETYMCRMCSVFADISGDLIRKDYVFAVLNGRGNGTSLPMVSSGEKNLYLAPMKCEDAKRLLNNSPEKVVRIYSKNLFRTGLSLAAKLWMGDYAAKNEDGSLKTFIELAKCSKGIQRIGILRADVDNLGTAFVRGFIRDNDEENKYRYETISRTATLSRSLSLFFKYHINNLMENPEYSLAGKKGKRNVVVVYSGGDDLFIVGAWDEVLSAAVDIRNAFRRYTDGALTLSAGLAVYDEKYPISLMAEETAELEQRAKQHEHKNGTKNSISLFGLEHDNGSLVDRHTYDWDTFEEKVLGEKYTAIKTFFESGEDYGNAFLYNILRLLRQAEKEKINIARLAFLLARREPGENAPEKLKEAYSELSANLYKWSLNADDRKQLITALIIYIYTRREEKEDKNG